MRNTRLFFTLLSCVTFVQGAAPQCQRYGAMGGEVIIDINGLKHPWKTEDHLVWKHNDNRVYDSKRKNHDKANLDVLNNGSLILKNLKPNHSGNYSTEGFNTEGSSVHKSSTWLCVIEKVSKPTILKPHCKESQVILICDVRNAGDQPLEWLKNNFSMKSKDKNLTLKLKDIKGSDVFSCKVKNKVSEETSSDVKVDCPGSKKLFGLDFWLMIAILATGGGLALILIVVIAVCLCRRRQQNRNREREEEELRLANMMQQSYPPRYMDPPPRGKPGPSIHYENAEGQTPVPPKPRGKRPRPPPVPEPDEEQPPPRPRPRQSGPRHNRS